VRAGETVRRGQTLGLVGMSGYTEFPHLHFEVRYRGATVDPFLGREAGEPCALGRNPLWQKGDLEALSYVAGGLLDAGISAAPPILDEGVVDRDKTVVFASNSPAVVFWVHIYGAQDNDVQEMFLSAPDGRVLAMQRARISGNRAQWLAYIGKRSGGSPWPPGAYRGEYALLRGPGEQRVISLVREVTLAQ
jgi:hypothetical protein